MFKRKTPGFIVIHGENLSFIIPDHHSGWQCMESFPMSTFLDADMSVDMSNRKYRDYDFSLMVVPDFWFGNKSFDFHSKDKTAIESYIVRKLKHEFPDTTEIQNLFSYKTVKNNKGKQGLVSLFLQEPKAGEICKRLSKYNIRPVRVTSPALLWNQRLKKTVDSFEESGIGLIYLLKDECFLLFYHFGSFLFSRAIPLPETGENDSSRFESLSFEINQSSYHFSQRTKSQLDKIFLISRGDDDYNQIKESLGRDIDFLDADTQTSSQNDELTEKLGLAADFTQDELFPPQTVPGISDRLLIKEIEVNKIQVSGIIVGVFLFLLLGMELLFLQDIKRRETYVSQTEEDPKQIIGQYNESLDSLLIATQRKKPLSVIGRLAASLPENILINEVEIDLEESNFLSFKGTITAVDMNDFSTSLKIMVQALNNNFNFSDPMSIDDVEIDMSGNRFKNRRQDYHISFFRYLS